MFTENLFFVYLQHEGYARQWFPNAWVARYCFAQIK